MRSAKTMNRAFILIGAILIIVSLLVVIKPEIVGFTLFEFADNTNHPPKWIGDKTFQINGPASVDLNTYFIDPDGDQLTFLATKEEGLEVSIYQNRINFMPYSPGTYGIAVMSSDEVSTARVLVTVVVA